MKTKDKRLSRKEAAEYLGVSPETLTKWAYIGSPRIPYFKAGKKCIYRLSDLDAFIDRRMCGTPDEAA